MLVPLTALFPANPLIRCPDHRVTSQTSPQRKPLPLSNLPPVHPSTPQSGPFAPYRPSPAARPPQSSTAAHPRFPDSQGSPPLHISLPVSPPTTDIPKAPEPRQRYSRQHSGLM